MVSFQCHACGDVVKKPKLDQHRGRCHTGFDCIDCHTTFNTPGDYKGHTQCISEAEKYQKTLYKGPKGAVAAPRNNYPPLPANTAPPQARGWQQQRGRGGYGGGGWGRARPSATGANDTPLGTPLRNSPLPSPKPVVAEPVPVPAPIPSSAPAPSPPKSEKKRKHVDESATTSDLSNGHAVNKKAKIDAAEEPPAIDALEISKKKSKKSKSDGEKKEKEKKRKGHQEATSDIAESNKSKSNGDAKKEKERKRKEPHEATSDIAEPDGDRSIDIDTLETNKKKSKKSKSDGEKKEKEKKRKESQETTSDIAESNGEQPVEKVKKHKKQKHSAPEAEPGTEEPKKKSKSRRAKEDKVADDIAVVQQDIAEQVEPPIGGEPALSEKEKRRKEKREKRGKKTSVKT